MNDSGQFGFGGMYVGEMECSLSLPYSMKDELKGGKIILDFGAETSAGIEWIPLGEWNITDCSRDVNDRVKLVCMDNLNLLKKNTESEKLKFVGVVSVEKLMKHVTSLTGVEFAQTPEELKELSGWNLETDIFATHYGQTAWDEVRAIAQILGCFAFANREGKVEFRRLDNSTPVLEIPAERRHKAALEEYTYSVRGIHYTDSDGYTVGQLFVGAKDNGAQLGFSDCLLVWETQDNPDEQYTTYLQKISPNIRNISFTPGTVDYYGNPALDVGDYVTISGGTARHSGSVPFLICRNEWKFRGPQTLTACGFSETGSDGSSSVSRETEQIRSVSVAKTIKYISGTAFPGTLFAEPRAVARLDFSSRTQTPVFLECSLVLSGGAEASAVYLYIYVNDVMQAYNPVFTVHAEEYTSVHFSLPLTVGGGTHSIEIKAVGEASAESISFYVWGQNIAEISSEETNEEDYIYAVSDGTAEIMYYIGDSTYPEIPSELGGFPVTKIAATAFSRSDITGVYIPEGVTEII